MKVTNVSIAAPTTSSPTLQSTPPHRSVDLIGASDLCGALAQRWAFLRSHNVNNASPYYDIEFTRAVSRVRDDVEIAVIHEDDDIVAFFPFQRITPNHAEPVGGRLNDWHGLIAMPNVQISLENLLKSLGLSSFGFHAMTGSNCELTPYEFEKLETFHLDLSDGYDGYLAWAKKNSSTLKRHGQKARAMERDLGDVRFEFDSSDPLVLDELIRLKREKYQRSKTFDILSVEWASQLLSEIHEIRKNGFQGLLSVLWVKDRIAAVHMGMLSHDTLHYWFPVLAPEFRKYSPGTELLLRCAEEAASRGVKKLDLGYGDDQYKLKFCNGREEVSCGQINFSSMQFLLAKKRYEVRNQLKGIPMKPTVKRFFRRAFPRFGQGKFK